MDAFIDTLKDRELTEVKVRLDELSGELHREGLYFATYENLETLVIISKEIQTTSFDLQQDMNYDVMVTKSEQDLDFSLDLERGNISDWEPISHYESKKHLNLIKVLQHHNNVTLDTNFPSQPFSIKVGGKPMPAIIFRKGDLN